MSKHIANKNARLYVNRREDFTGSHLYAETITKDAGGLRQKIREARGEPLEVYAVFSYGSHFPIYAHIAGVWYRNRGKYSVSTSRHQSQARPDTGAFVDMSTEELQALIGY